MLTLNIGSMSQVRQPFMKILQINLRKRLIYWRIQRIMGCIGKLLSTIGNRVDTDNTLSSQHNIVGKDQRPISISQNPNLAGVHS